LCTTLADFASAQNLVKIQTTETVAEDCSISELSFSESPSAQSLSVMRRYGRDRGRTRNVSHIDIPASSRSLSTHPSKVPARARLRSSVEAKRTPSSSVRPVTSTANGRCLPRRFSPATQEIAVTGLVATFHFRASRTVL
jgi:hypothetical protein